MDGQATLNERMVTVGSIILLGAPGAGKGTQAKKIAGHYSIPHISTGDLLRDHVARGSELGKKAKAIMERGDLVPDDLVLAMVEERLNRPDCSRGFIGDGFPRTVKQAEWLDQYLSGKVFENQGDRKLAPIVINIAVGYNQLMRRLTGRRSCPTCGRIYNVYSQPPSVDELCDVDGGKLETRRDDREEVIAERLKAYEAQTRPLTEYYRARGQYFEIDGDQTPDAVSAEVTKIIDGHRL